MRISDWSSDVCSSDLEANILASFGQAGRMPVVDNDIFLVGATGLVGRAVVRAAGERVLTLLARREVDDLPDHHARLVAPPARWGDILAAERPAALICCPGTTLRHAGPRAALPPATPAPVRQRSGKGPG